MSSNISDFTEKQGLIEECEAGSVCVEEIVKLAKLARIKVTDQEKHEYAKELAMVVNWFQKLDAIDMKQGGLEQLAAITIDELADDKAGADHSNVLQGTEVEHDYFVVPKIIENN